MSPTADFIYYSWYAIDTIQGSLAKTVRDNCYAQGQSIAVCERLNASVYEHSLSIITFGSAALVAAYSAAQYGRTLYSLYHYNRYKHKEDTELEAQPISQKKAFENGRYASRSCLHLFASNFNPQNTYRCGAFWAGYHAEQSQDNHLKSTMGQSKRRP